MTGAEDRTLGNDGLRVAVVVGALKMIGVELDVVVSKDKGPYTTVAIVGDCTVPPDYKEQLCDLLHLSRVDMVAPADMGKALLPIASELGLRVEDRPKEELIALLEKTSVRNLVVQWTGQSLYMHEPTEELRASLAELARSVASSHIFPIEGMLHYDSCESIEDRLALMCEYGFMQSIGVFDGPGLGYKDPIVWMYIADRDPDVMKPKFRTAPCTVPCQPVHAGNPLDAFLVGVCGMYGRRHQAMMLARLTPVPQIMDLIKSTRLAHVISALLP